MSKGINFDTQRLMNDISSIVGDLGFSDGITLERGLYYLAVALLMWKATTVAVKALTSGGEQPINFELLNPVITSTLLIALYPYMYSYFQSGINAVLAYYDGVNFKAAEAKNEFATYIARIRTAQSEIDEGFSVDIVSKTIREAKNDLFNSTLDGIYEVMKTIDSGILYIFGFVAFLWLVVLKLSAPLVLVLRLFKPTESSLFLWVKNFISVSLWIPFASLVLTIANKVMINQISDMMVGFNERLSVGAFEMQLLLALYLTIIAVMLIFIIIKIVLITKVPQMIASFVGNTSSDGGFGMGFMAISFGKEAATAVATKGASLAGKAGGAEKLKK